MPPKKGNPLSASHKAALAEGRREGRLIRDYLEALDAHKPKRGRKRTPDSIKKRLADIEGQIETASPMKRVSMVQERLNLEHELSATEEKVDLSQLESGFVAAAASYSKRKGISYSAWRAVGVPAGALKKAGITRGS